MEFLFRTAEREDLPEIIRIMKETKENVKNADWFVADDESYVASHIEDDGFVVVSETMDHDMAGFFIIKYPAEQENLGKYLSYSKEQLEKVAVMDSVAVKEKYRGNQLQYKMLRYAEEKLDKTHYAFLMCTIHPDNQYSLNNMQKNGYIVKKRVLCYGGLDRYILVKEI